MILCDIYESHDGGFYLTLVCRLYVPSTMLEYQGERWGEPCYYVTDEGFEFLRDYLCLDGRNRKYFELYQVVDEDNDSVITRLTNQLKNLTKSL